MQIALVLYPKFTALDIVGPFQTFADVPDVDAFFVAEQAGPVVDHTGRFTLEATHAFADVGRPDVVVVPGGPGSRDPQHDPLVAWLQKVHPTTTWTTSVCTGSILLARAGLLEGTDAACHWAYTDHLVELGAKPTPERVVERGRIMTAAGVSSGIDMGLTLVGRMFGDDTAEAVQLAIEYDPQPPYDSGSPAKARPEIVELVRALSMD